MSDEVWTDVPDDAPPYADAEGLLDALEDAEPEPDAEEADEWTEEAPAELADDVGHATAVLDDRPVVVSAFAGIGGLDRGFELAGYQTGVQIEWDAAASRVLAHRFPNAARFGDVRHVTGDSVRRALGGRRVDVLCGGFPCQDLSVAGRRAGMAGERSGLYGELLRLAAEIRPRWLVVENVPGLLSADADPDANGGAGYGFGSGFALLLGDLTGYRPPVPDGGWRNSGVCSGPLGTAAWRVLDARHFGVAQRRRRVFVVFSSGDRAAPAAVLLEPEGVRWDPAAGRPSWSRAAAPAVGAAVRGGGGGADGGGAGDAGAAVAHAVTAGGAGAGRPRDAEGNLVGEMGATWAPDVANPVNAPSTGGQRNDLEGMTYVPVATNELEGGVARAIRSQPADPNDYSQATYVATDEVAPTLLAGPTSPASHGKRSGDDRGALVVAADVRNGLLDEDVTGTIQSHGQSYSLNAQPTVVDGRDEATGGIQLYPDGNVGFEPHAATVMAAGNVNVVDGRDVVPFTENRPGEVYLHEDDEAGALTSGGGKPGQGYQAVVDARPVGAVEAGGGDDVAPTVTSKWHKGRGGPAGSETGNLVVVGDGGTEVSHPVTASGTDGMGRGVPAVAFSGSDDGDDAAEELAPTLRQAGKGHGKDAAVAASPHQPVVTEHRGGWAVYCDACSLEAGDYVYPCRRGVPFPPPVLVEPARAYVVDKERGLPNDEGIRVAEADVAPPLLADGDPAERTDRGTRVVQSYDMTNDSLGGELAPTLQAGAQSSGNRGAAVVVSPALTAQMRNASGSLGHSGGDERVIAVLAAEQEAVAFAEGKTGQSTSDVAPTLQAAVPSDSSNRQTAVVTYRKARRPQTNQDEETWEEADYANTLNLFDQGDSRATQVVVEPAEGVDVLNQELTGDVAHTVRGGHDQGVPRVVDRHGHVQGGSNQDQFVGPDGTAPTLVGGGNTHAGHHQPKVVLPADDPRAVGFGHTQGLNPQASTEAFPTLRREGGGAGVSAHAAVRRLTPRECERLQGFPDDWTLVAGRDGKPATDSPRYKQLGNAVCANVAEWIAYRIRAHDDGMLG